MAIAQRPRMKESGAEWIGEIPEHWSCARTRLVARLESGHTPSRNHPEYWVNCNVPWFTLADVWQLRDGSQKYVHDTKELVSEMGLANSSARLLPKDTVILSRTASVGFSAIMGVPMATTQDFVNWVCGPRIIPTFLLWVFRGMKQEFERLMMGSTHKTIYMPDAEQFSTPLPPLPEQRAIAAFLDRKTAQIDAVVAKKQRLIERLQEKRQALISHAVTKGLDPHAPMKDSGIEWLGQIPAHWAIKRLKHISPRVGVGLVINPSTYVKNEGVPFLFGGDIQPGKILVEKARRMSDEDSRKLPQSRLYPGDLVTVRVGYPGVTAVVPPELEGANCASVMVVRGAATFVSQWLCYAMNSTLGSDQINVVKYGAAQEQFNISHAVEFVFPVPPKEEQQTLADHLDSELKKMEGIEERLTLQIAMLQEYRQTLISAAVTGKIDVACASGHPSEVKS